MTEPTRYVLDASVLVAFLRPGEPSHSDTDTLLAALTLRQATLSVPAIAFAEVAAAIARGEDDATQAMNAVVIVSKLPGLHVAPVNGALGGLAARVAAQQRIRGCDAIYVALAQELGATLITLDREQRERTPATVVTLTPGEVLADLPRS